MTFEMLEKMLTQTKCSDFAINSNQVFRLCYQLKPSVPTLLSTQIKCSDFAINSNQVFRLCYQ